MLKRGSESCPRFILGLFLHEIHAKKGVSVGHGHVATPHPYFRRFTPTFILPPSILITLPRPSQLASSASPCRDARSHAPQPHLAVRSLPASLCFALHGVTAEVLCNFSYYFKRDFARRPWIFSRGRSESCSSARLECCTS